MNKQIKMSYAGKDVRLTVDENDKLVKVEVRKAGDPNQFEEVKSSWIGKTPSWNKLDEFLSEAAGVKVQKRRLFDSFESLKAELFDAPVEVKQAFNDVVQYFESSYESYQKFLKEHNYLKPYKVWRVVYYLHPSPGVTKEKVVNKGPLAYEDASKIASEFKIPEYKGPGKSSKKAVVDRIKELADKVIKEAKVKGDL